jgi:aryl-alcohol dehydrogenase-like predicted oxidoreductase
MRKTKLGPNGPMVSSLSLGGHEYMGNGKSRGFNEDMSLAVSPGYIGTGYGGPQRRALLNCAYDLGVNFFDVTIDSEKEALGRNFAESPPPYEVFIQTRPEGMCYSYDSCNRKMLDLELLRAEVQRGLKLLEREALDFLNLGLLAWSIDARPDYLARLAENIMVLKREGLVRWAVADSFSGERLYLAMIACGAFDVVNIDLNVGDALGLRKVLPAAREAGLGVIGREAFFKGELFGMGVSAGIEDRSLLARTALKWVAAQGLDTLIVGVNDVNQLRANAEAFESAALDAQEEETLERLRKVPKFLVYENAKRREFMEIS